MRWLPSATREAYRNFALDVLGAAYVFQ